MNKQLGDRIMSAIDLKLTGGTITGEKGDDRILMTWNGKFLSHIERTT